MKRLILFLLLVTACFNGSAAGDGFVLSEGSINGPELIPSGISELNVSNAGEFPHTFVVTDHAGEVVAATDILPPGAEIVVPIDVTSGSYLVSCRLITQSPDGAIIDHYQEGMFKSLTADG
jgi:hypothetical protein